MATRAWHNIQTVVAFLTTRVESPDEDDWGKLKRVLKFLNGTKYLKLKPRVDDHGLLKWCVEGHTMYRETVEVTQEQCSALEREQ
jgi:hypothetical protein